MLIALIAVAAIFGLLFLVRLGGARRQILVQKWPSLMLGTVALVLLARGALWPAIALGACAWLAWLLWPRPGQAVAVQTDRADADARALLGVRPNASEAEIRDAFRERMRTAHPDRGGSHALAARITAARDRLLRKMQQR